MEANSKNTKKQLKINPANQEEKNVKLTPEEQIERLKDMVKNLAQRCASLENTWILSRASLLNEVVKCNSYNENFRERCATELEEFLFPKEESK